MNEEYNTIDIWYDAIQIDKEKHKHEKDLLNYYKTRMQPSWNKRIVGQYYSVFERWENQPLRFFYF